MSLSSTLRPISATCRAARPLQRACRIQQRSLFSLPSLPSFPGLPGGSTAPQTYSEERILPYTPKEMYAVVADVASYPQFVPFCTGARTPPRALENAMAGRTRVEAELSVGFMAFQESYVSEVESIPYREVKAVASSTTPLFKALSTTWRFSSASSPSSFSTPSTNPTQGVSAAFFGKVSGLMIEAFEKRCQDIYGKR